MSDPVYEHTPTTPTTLSINVVIVVLYSSYPILREIQLQGGTLILQLYVICMYYSLKESPLQGACNLERASGTLILPLSVL